MHISTVCLQSTYLMRAISRIQIQYAVLLNTHLGATVKHSRSRGLDPGEHQIAVGVVCSFLWQLLANL